MDATIAKLIFSNSQWLSAVNAAEPGFFEESAQVQTPKILWIGCSDSRVPESVITASRPGDMFVHRNIANQVHPDDDNLLSVLTFAVKELCIEHILVVGHTQCAGAAACLKAATATVPPQDETTPTTPLARWLAPLAALVRGLDHETLHGPEALTKVIEANVRQQVENVVNTEPVQSAWAGKKKLWVHGFLYELESGSLRDLSVTQGHSSC